MKQIMKFQKQIAVCCVFSSLLIMLIVREQIGLLFNSYHSEGLKTISNRERPAD